MGAVVSPGSSQHGPLAGDGPSAPLVHASDELLECLLHAFLLLSHREHLEQSRFVVRPISTFGALEDGERAGTGEGERLQQRWVTAVAYQAPGHRHPLALQRETMRRLSMRQPSQEAATAAAAVEGGVPEEAAVEEAAASAWAVGGTCPPEFWSSPGDGGGRRWGGLRGWGLCDERQVPGWAPGVSELAVGCRWAALEPPTGLWTPNSASCSLP